MQLGALNPIILLKITPPSLYLGGVGGDWISRGSWRGHRISRGSWRGHWITRGSWRGVTCDMDRSIEHARSIKVFLCIVFSHTPNITVGRREHATVFVMLLEFNQQIKQENTVHQTGGGRVVHEQIIV